MLGACRWGKVCYQAHVTPEVFCQFLTIGDGLVSFIRSQLIASPMSQTQVTNTRTIPSASLTAFADTAGFATILLTSA